MIAITNVRAVLYDRVLENAVILTDGERIAAVGAAGEVKIPCGCKTIDGGGLYASAGFVDIHVHGGGSSMFASDPAGAAKHFLSYGETTVLPTLYYDLSREELVAAIKRIKAVMADGSAKNIAGLYMEGPYMNPEYGAAPDKNKWKGVIKRSDYCDVVDEAGALAKVWVVAPEREGIEEFVSYAKEINPSAIISVGHSEATPEQVFRLKKYGMKLLTHAMNATGRLPALKGTRNCGPDEACLMDKDMYAEMISDSLAIHVHADMQRLLLTVKGIDKMLLISDSFVSDETPRPELAAVTDLSFDYNGDLCGSKLTLNVAVRNVMKHTGCPLFEAVRMATLNPATVVGMEKEIGSLEAGKKANVVLFDEEINVKKIMLHGSFID